MKEIGYEEKALELISHYFDNGFVRKDDLALPPGHPLRDIKDVDVVKAFNKHASSIIDSRPIDDIIKEISEDQCTRMSVQALSLFSVDEIKGQYVAFAVLESNQQSKTALPIRISSTLESL